MTRSTVPADAARSAATPAIEALESQLAQLFAAGRQYLQNRAAAVHPDLSPGAYKVLTLLVRGGPTHATVLAAKLGVDKSAISRIIRQLEDLAMAERGADPADGRAWVITATAGAVAKVNAVRDDARAALHRYLSGWDRSDVEQFTALLAKLNGVMEPPA